MPILLTSEQNSAVNELIRFERLVQTLGGYAGTGKTTVIKSIKQKLPNFAVCAFTGKAANVLRRKGVPASTIHSLIYKCEVMKRRDANGKEHQDVIFKLRESADIEEHFAGFIVDEASMVSRAIYEDICSFGLPVIFVGDHGQIEPVGGEGFNLMQYPSITLEKVHRNAGEILHFANFIREGNRPKDWRKHELATGDGVQFVSIRELGPATTEPDQYICAFNRTRIAMNEAYREQLGYPADRPVVRDRVMCLQNNAGLGVYNGMQGRIVALFGDELVFDSGGEEYRTRFVPEQFNRAKVDRWTRSDRLPFDYAYVITAHKSQGDEWDHVLVFEQVCPAWEHSRWAYTAASRARTQLTWVPA
jgi:exodeoxyribonuclease-5